MFSPHPPIAVTDDVAVQKHFRVVRDEEDGLPTHNPPSWEDYRDAANATIRAGSLVHCSVAEEPSGRYTLDKRRPKYGYDAASRPAICEVERVERDRKHVWLRWSLGPRKRVTWELDTSRPVKDKPGWFYQKKVDTPLPERFGHQRVPVDKVFAVAGYKRGDYKIFLCDAALKGAYLEWAPPLLNCEKWHMEAAKRK